MAREYVLHINLSGENKHDKGANKKELSKEELEKRANKAEAKEIRDTYKTISDPIGTLTDNLEGLGTGGIIAATAITETISVASTYVGMGLNNYMSMNGDSTRKATINNIQNTAK